MSKPFRFGSAVSLVALGSIIAGCAMPQAHTASASHFGGKADEDIGVATRALAAFQANNIPLAIQLAERAVAKTPDDAGFRALLGNAYFAGGRFRSAEAAYKGSLTIYSNQPQVVLKLALVEIALGKNDQAVAFLDAGREVLDPADYGLAIALAGHPADAVQVLQGAARAQGADSRVRQNLALAYAFAGDWTEARTVAAQDVPANQLDARIQQWMQLAKPGKPSDQVAALLGVTPAPGDQGQPVQLALRKPDGEMAQATPAPVPTPTAPAVARARPDQPQFTEVVAPPPPPAPLPAVAPAPLPPPPVTMGSIAAAAVSEAKAAWAYVAPHRAPAHRSSITLKLPPPRPALHSGDAVMQLGAYKSPQAVGTAWNHLTQRYPALHAYLPLRAKFQSAKGTFWRLSIQGFSNQGQALARCQLLKSHGGNCFVRTTAGDAALQIALR